ERSYFTPRVPRTVTFPMRDDDPDQYAQLYSDRVIEVINGLELPHYGLGQYTVKNAERLAAPHEKATVANLSRAGRRLMGFCRTNLFKRLESSGKVFLQSLERHILRNYIFLYALENKLPLPIGTQDAAMLDTRSSDIDVDDLNVSMSLFETDDENGETDMPTVDELVSQLSEAAFEQ